ncbi:MAG: aldo/keto reductase family protein [Gammaproteobacteria bacterium]
MERFVEVQGVRVPRFMYGTAWKEHRTEGLTRLALEAGFRGIDTANQRKHYFEAGVGAAIAAAAIARAGLFLQTKFTYVRGQDHRLPYDPDAPLGRQVEQSFASSLEHLGVDHVDSYVLHGPESGRGWSAADREVWSAMERLHRERRARLLGVSNISRDQLMTLCASATVAPAFVQNRCYARTGWDQEVIVYQGFSLLTANQRELRGATVAAIARRLGTTIPQVVFPFAFAVGIVALTGTSDRTHMQQDLAAIDLAITESDVAALERLR